MTLTKQLFTVSLMLICFFIVTKSVADRPILDENGNETGSYNANPDPDGEAWIYTPLEVTEEVKAKLASIPEWKPDKSKARQLPSSVNHFKEKEFHSPVLNQKGGSCSAASGVGHHYTWEANILTGADGSESENKSMYYFAYNFLNGGGTGGIWYYHAWDILKKVGCVSENDWPSPIGSEKTTEWADTYEAYHNGNFTRCDDYYQIKDPGGAGLEDLKQWFYDYGTGNERGGCVTFNSGISFGMKTIPEGSAEAGSKIATSFDGTGTAHAMMYAGYNDDVYYNSNNKGAVLLVNSWGSSFGDNGIMWVPYNLFKSERDVYLIEVVEHIPRLEFKVTLEGYRKSGGSFTSGFATSAGATSPTETQTYGKAFGGNTGSFSGEIGLDCSSFWEEFAGNGGQGKFFLTTKGSGTVSALSLMIYDKTGTNLVEEIECDQTNVSIPGTLTIVLAGTEIQSSLFTAAKRPIKIRDIGNAYTMYVPFNTRCEIAISNVKGQELFQLNTNREDWYTVAKSFAPGVNIVHVKTAGQTYVQKFESVH